MMHVERPATIESKLPLDQRRGSSDQRQALAIGLASDRSDTSRPFRVERTPGLLQFVRLNSWSGALKQRVMPGLPRP